MVRIGRVGGVSDKMRSDNFYKWIKPFITDRDLETIIRNRANPARQFQTLDDIFTRADLPPSFFDEIYMSERQDVIRRLEQEAMTIPSLSKMSDKDTFGFDRGGVGGFEKSPDKMKGLHTQKAKTGVVYTRTYRRWTRKEELFIASRVKDYKAKKVSLTTLRMDLKKVSGVERSSSSVSTKISRVSKDGERFEDVKKLQ